ncbi:GGDEF domain-containing protein [Paraglaciecola agarilytica]|nr:GGDEF domain-containing protein [Paraglaciecola agarilytica]
MTYFHVLRKLSVMALNIGAHFRLLSLLLIGFGLFSHSVSAQPLDRCQLLSDNNKTKVSDLTLAAALSLPVTQFDNLFSFQCSLEQPRVLMTKDGFIRHSVLLINGVEQSALAANQLAYALPQGNFKLAFQIDAEKDFTASLRLQSWRDYALVGQQHNLLLGLFFGLCITLVFYLFFMGRSLNDERFHYYCYYVLCAGVFFLLQEGNLDLFLNGSTFNNRSVNLLFAGLTVFSGTIFVVALLDLQRRWPRFTRFTVVYPAAFVLAISIALQFMARGQLFSWLSSVMSIITMLLMLCTFALIGYASYLRVHTARLVLLASCIVCCAMVFRLWFGDVSPFIERYGLIYSFAIESFLLAIATSERIKRINNDKIFAQAQAMTDSLCEVLNRRGWENAAQKMLSEHQAKGGVLCLLYIDLDNFKQINDSYGHKAGDEVLQIIAKIIRKQMRDQDVVGRLGGDEFVGLARFEDESLPMALKARMTQRLHNIKISTDSVQIKVNASVGCVTFAHSDISVSDMLHKADHAMYIRKREKQSTI